LQASWLGSSSSNINTPMLKQPDKTSNKSNIECSSQSIALATLGAVLAPVSASIRVL
jgi:hypothetical protein